MKPFTFVTICTFCFFSVELFSQGDAKNNPGLSGIALLKTMHEKYYHKPCKSYTFSQKNTHYRNDSMIKHSEWHEAIEFPDKFRINFGDKSEGNFVLLNRDSVYKYKAGSQVNRRADSSSILLLIGGMYYRELEDVLGRLKNKGYDLHTLSEQDWNGSPALVIGALHNDLVSNQIWVDKKTLCVLRVIETINVIDIMDMRFEAHQKWCGGFVETKVSFRRNGHLEQVEEYYDLKKTDSFSEQ